MAAIDSASVVATRVTLTVGVGATVLPRYAAPWHRFGVTGRQFADGARHPHAVSYPASSMGMPSISAPHDRATAIAASSILAKRSTRNVACRIIPTSYR